jgi:hypothetical protein
MNTSYTSERFGNSVGNAASHTVKEYPMATALTALGAGIGTGLLIGWAIAGQTSKLASSSNPIEDFGHKMLDRVSSYIPEGTLEGWRG